MGVGTGSSNGFFSRTTGNLANASRIAIRFSRRSLNCESISARIARSLLEPGDAARSAPNCCSSEPNSIPMNAGSIDALYAVGVINDSEAEKGIVPGAERAIPKNKGIEFGSLLHQLGVDLLTKPFSTEVRDIFLSIAPDAKERLPKRGAKKEPEPVKQPPKVEGPPKAEPLAKAASAAKPEPARHADGKKPPEAGTAAAKKGEAPVAPAGKDKSREAAGKKPPAAEGKGKPAAAKPSAAKSKPPAEKKSSAEKASSKGLAKSKPR